MTREACHGRSQSNRVPRAEFTPKGAPGRAARTARREQSEPETVPRSDRPGHRDRGSVTRTDRPGQGELARAIRSSRRPGLLRPAGRVGASVERARPSAPARPTADRRANRARPARAWLLTGRGRPFWCVSPAERADASSCTPRGTSGRPGRAPCRRDPPADRPTAARGRCARPSGSDRPCGRAFRPGNAARVARPAGRTAGARRVGPAPAAAEPARSSGTPRARPAPRPERAVAAPSAATG